MPNKVNVLGFLISVTNLHCCSVVAHENYKPHRWKAPQGQHLFTFKRFLILKVLKSSLIVV